MFSRRSLLSPGFPVAVAIGINFDYRSIWRFKKRREREERALFVLCPRMLDRGRL